MREIVDERDPERIGINRSELWGLADGIVATDYEHLLENLGEKYASRVVSAEKVAVGWLKPFEKSVISILIVRIA